MQIPIGIYGDALALEKELVIDTFNHTFLDGVSGVGKSTLLEDKTGTRASKSVSTTNTTLGK